MLGTIFHIGGSGCISEQACETHVQVLYGGRTEVRWIRVLLRFFEDAVEVVIVVDCPSLYENVITALLLRRSLPDKTFSQVGLRILVTDGLCEWVSDQSFASRWWELPSFSWTFNGSRRQDRMQCWGCFEF